VPQRHWITLSADRAIDRLPCTELVARPSARAEHFLEEAELTQRPYDLSLRRAAKWPLRRGELPVRDHEGVRVLVDVHELIAAKSDRIRLQHPAAAEEVRMLEHHRERLPATRRCTLQQPCV